jgi:hypothetical protein
MPLGSLVTGPFSGISRVPLAVRIRLLKKAAKAAALLLLLASLRHCRLPKKLESGSGGTQENR